jgi:hypothetical protein
VVSLDRPVAIAIFALLTIVSPLYLDLMPLFTIRTPGPTLRPGFLVYLLFAGFMLFGEGMYMHDDLTGLANDLKNADENMLREIIREAELFLDSQLTAGTAADQRAVTFSSVLAATAAVLIGGFVASFATTAPTIKLAWVVFPMSAGLIIATVFSTLACRPTEWRYPGSNPRHWAEDAKAKVSMVDALAEQAGLYAIAIGKNKDVLEKNARLMKWALQTSGLTLLLGTVAGIAVAST